ncbi:ArsO family NAD(P)H-dependent flavin-containing monooxygenase [Larkinella sp. VNQ87]|uniref:ArsO family NAD(P)H-dependent flavin-containing monooxygenase n=1 Tax=Larkinella sp. VNQ87 TaxID=3400921 RepID=UPI003C01EB96
MNEPVIRDVIIIGGGQSGLATAYNLRRSSLDFLLLDEQAQPGGAWLHGWKSLRLFSPADASSLPGWLMPRTHELYPTRQDVIDYLTHYEQRYGFPVQRPVRVASVEQIDAGFRLKTDRGEYQTRALVCATGSWSQPYSPDYPGRKTFQGLQQHSAFYATPDEFRGKRVLVVGGGNSGAQILAEVSKVADATWMTLQEPTFLPDEVDGRFLFQAATQRFQSGNTAQGGGLADIVMVDSVKEARSRGVLQAVRPFTALIQNGVVWPDGRQESIDAIIWCTGFRPALGFLEPLGVLTPEGRVQVQGTRSVRQPGLWLVGYGNWTGFASATLIGVNRSARQTAREVIDYLQSPNRS